MRKRGIAADGALRSVVADEGADLGSGVLAPREIHEGLELRVDERVFDLDGHGGFSGGCFSLFTPFTRGNGDGYTTPPPHFKRQQRKRRKAPVPGTGGRVEGLKS